MYEVNGVCVFKLELLPEGVSVDWSTETGQVTTGIALPLSWLVCC